MFIFNIIRRKLLNALIMLVISFSAHAVKPANVVVLVDQADVATQQQTVNMLYSTTWQMLDGEFDVRFTTPRITKVDEVYSDDDVDLVIALGNQGVATVQQRKVVEKPTIIVNQSDVAAMSERSENLVGMSMNQSETSEVFIERVVVALREKLRHK